MIRTLALCAISAALAVTLTIVFGEWRGAEGLAAIADAETLVPSCLHATYGADGNMGPLFCVIDNPVALRYFAPMAKRTFALGPDATPTQVSDALVADTRAGPGQRWKLGLPMLCSVYQLAAWKNHWRFGISVVYEVSEALHAYSGWCREPSFEGI
jgi:hypothetical protein